MRLVNIKEFFLSPNAEAPTADAWIHNTITTVTADGDLDFTGFASAVINCGGWTVTAGIGSLVTVDGKSGRTVNPDCNTLRPVTCCVPQ